MRLIGAKSKADIAAAKSVLVEFFRLVGDIWIQERCEREIERFQKKAAQNREVGKLGGRPRKKETQVVTEKSAENNHGGYFSKPSQSPDTSLQEKTSEAIASGKPDLLPVSPGDTIFGLGISLLTSAGVSERNCRSMLGLMRKQHGDAKVIDALQRCADEKPLQPVAWLQGVLKAAQPDGKKPIRTAKERDSANRAEWIREHTGGLFDRAFPSDNVIEMETARAPLIGKN